MKSSRVDLPPELQGIATPRCPALAQVRLVGIEDRPSARWVRALGEHAGAEEAAHGLAADAHLPRDVLLGQSLAVQRDDAVVAPDPRCALSVVVVGRVGACGRRDGGDRTTSGIGRRRRRRGVRPVDGGGDLRQQ